MRRGERRAGVTVEKRPSSGIHLERTLGKEKGSTVGELVKRVGARLELGHRPDQKRFLVARETKFRRDQLGQPYIVRLADVMAVEVFEFLEVETRRRFADMVEVEPLDRLIAVDDFVVAVPPAQPEQIIVDRFGKHSKLVAIGIDTERSVALRKLRPIQIGRASCRERV